MEWGNNTVGSFLPVIFFDGVREIEIGNVGVFPTMNYKLFQSIISQKIGISPHQITIYYENYSTSSSFKKPHRFPVTNKFNFATAYREPNCFFWVVLKRSRRVRRRKPKQSIPTSGGGVGGGPDSDDNHSVVSQDEFVMGGRRNTNSLQIGTYGDQFSPAQGGIGAENCYKGTDFVGYANNRLRALETERERYLMSLNMNSNVYSDMNVRDATAGFGMNNLERMLSDDGASCSSSSFSGGGGGDRMVVCDVCATAKMVGQETVPFHCCKCDATVTFGFRSPAGPIARPTKHSG